ncbi:hypothetical protein Tco_0939851 [Tanacetum coccineum]|uniref:Uncharacterized protein n=1 Tax=Tanacetum coccineum TaxID=301880 RepID=A0ABQ5DLA2_9ASTR
MDAKDSKGEDDVSTSISPTIDIVSRITNIVQLIYHMLTLEHKAHDGQSQVVAYFVDISGYCSFWKYPICATNLGVMEI